MGAVMDCCSTPDLSKYYRKEAFSDVEITIVPEDVPPQWQIEVPEDFLQDIIDVTEIWKEWGIPVKGAVTLPGHSMVLIACSSYFETKVSAAGHPAWSSLVSQRVPLYSYLC